MSGVVLSWEQQSPYQFFRVKYSKGRTRRSTVWRPTVPLVEFEIRSKLWRRPAKRKRDNAQPQEAKRKCDSAQPQEMTAAPVCVYFLEAFFLASAFSSFAFLSAAFLSAFFFFAACFFASFSDFFSVAVG